MSTLGLTLPILPPMIPRRVHYEVPTHLITYFGRMGLNMYRTIDGNRTIQEIASLFGRTEHDVLKTMKRFQKAGYVTVEVSKHMSMEDRIACIPTLIVAHAELGLS